MTSLMSGSNVLVQSTPEGIEDESLLAAETYVEPQSSQRSYPQPENGGRDAALLLAFGPHSQVPVPPARSTSSTGSAPPASLLQSQSSPRQVVSYPVTQTTDSQSADDDRHPKPSTMLSTSAGARAGEPEPSFNSTATESQAFKYDRSAEDTSYMDSQAGTEQMEPTQLGTQFVATLVDNDDTDHSIDSTTHDRSSISDGAGRNASVQLPNGLEAEYVTDVISSGGGGGKREVTFSASTHAFDASQRIALAGTPLGKRLSRVLVAETPDEVPSAPVHAPSSPTSSSRPPVEMGLVMGQSSVGTGSRPSSPLSSAPASSNPGRALQARGSGSSTVSNSTVRREPAPIARAQPVPVIASPAPPSPTQNGFASTHLSATSFTNPAPPAPSPLRRSPSPSAALGPRGRNRHPQEDMHRSSSQVPETQPAPLRTRSTGSVATVPATSSNQSTASSRRKGFDMDEPDVDDGGSDFGHDSADEDSGAREARRWHAANAPSVSVYGSATRSGRDDRAPNAAEDDEVDELDDNDGNDENDYSAVMNNPIDDQQLSSLPFQFTTGRHHPQSRSSSQSPDPLAASYEHSTQPSGLDLAGLEDGPLTSGTKDAAPFPFPSSPPGTNAVAGPSRVGSKEVEKLKKRQVSLPAQPRERSPTPGTLDPASLMEDNVEVVIYSRESSAPAADRSTANQSATTSKSPGRVPLSDLNQDDEDGEQSPVASIGRMSSSSSDPLAGKKRTVDQVDAEEASNHDEDPPASVEVAREKSAKKSKKAQGKEKSVESTAPGTSAKRGGPRKSRASGGRSTKQAARRSMSSTTTPAKKTTVNGTRTHLARTPAKVPAREDAFTQGDALTDSDVSDETQQDPDDSTYTVDGASSSKKRKAPSETAPSTDGDDQDATDDEVEHDDDGRDATPEHDQDDESLAPPPKASPKKKTPYGKKSTKKLPPPPPRPALVNPGPSRTKRLRSESVTQFDSPGPSVHVNAVAGPSGGGLPPQPALPLAESSNRVFAPWKNKKIVDYYPANVSDLDEDGVHCAIAFDDDDHGRETLAKLRRCILNPGDMFVADKVQWVVAPSHLAGKVLDKGALVRAHRRGDSPKKTKNVSLRDVSIPTSLLAQFSDRTVSAADLVYKLSSPSRAIRPTTSTNDELAVPTSASASRTNKGKSRALPGVSYPNPQGGRHFANTGFVLSSCVKGEQIKRKILENGGIVADDINAFFAVGGVRAEGKMGDQTYRADEFALHEAFSGLTNVVVLTDEAARKPKMLKALALGVPVVASSWIERAKMDNSSWRSWVLSKPKSMMTPQSLSQHIHPAWGDDLQLLLDPLSPAHSIHGRRRPLDGDAIYCLATTAVERELLVFCCLAMGAISVTLQPNPSLVDPDTDQADLYILPDYEDVPARLRRNHSVRVVDVEWVKQTIIFGEKVFKDLARSLVDEMGADGGGVGPVGSGGKGTKATGGGGGGGGGPKKKQRG